MRAHEDELPGGLARSALQLLALGLLIAGTLWIVRPFLIPTIWATLLGVALWPLLLRTQAACGGRRAPAVVALTIALLLMLVVPLYLGIHAIVANAEDLAAWVQAIPTWNVPRPPDWLADVPLVGPRLSARWSELAAEGPQQLAETLSPQARGFARWLIREMGGLGALVLNFLLMTILASILFARGERAAGAMRRFARRLAGAPGERAPLLAGQAIRAVAMGVVLTAVLQTALVGVGFAVIGVPFAAILTALCFMLSVALIGPMPILFGVVIWAYREHGVMAGSAYLAWAVVCGTVDNVVRPVRIRRGADLPLLLIFGGVIGGLIAFGVIGLFVGPVVLAVAYMLLMEWMDEAVEPVLAADGAPEAGGLEIGAPDALAAAKPGASVRLDRHH